MWQDTHWYEGHAWPCSPPTLHPCLRGGRLTDWPPWEGGMRMPSSAAREVLQGGPVCPTAQARSAEPTLLGLVQHRGADSRGILGRPTVTIPPAPSLYPTKANTLISFVHFLAGPEHRREGKGWEVRGGRSRSRVVELPPWAAHSTAGTATPGPPHARVHAVFPLQGLRQMDGHFA